MSPSIGKFRWHKIVLGSRSKDSCIDILEESGFWPDSQFGVVSLIDVPNGLNAKELEEYLREHGAELSSPQANH